jgi:hypothetical protein
MSVRRKMALPRNPLDRPDCEKADIMALKAVARGEAGPELQQRVVVWIVQKVCGIGAVTWVPGDDRATAMNEGARLAGLHLMYCLEKPLEEVVNV